MDGMMKVMFSFVLTRAMLQKNAPSDKVNQDALISSLPAWPGAGNFIAPVITAQKLGQDEQTISNLESQRISDRQKSIPVDEIVDKLDAAIKNNLKATDIVNSIFDTQSRQEQLDNSLKRPGLDSIRATRTSSTSSRARTP